jgi:hypothetical protein
LPRPGGWSKEVKAALIAAAAGLVSLLVAHWLEQRKAPPPPPPRPPIHSDLFTYSGLAFDFADDKPLPNVEVSIASTPPVIAYTTSNGGFVAEVQKRGVGSGLVEIRYRLAGYQTYSHNVAPDLFRVPTVKLHRLPTPPAQPPPRPRPQPPPQPPPKDKRPHINLGVATSGARAVLIVDAGRVDTALAGRVAQNIGASALLFTPAFVESGAFARVHAGDLGPLRELPVGRMSLIALGTRSFRTTSGKAIGRQTFRVFVDLRVLVVQPAVDFASSVLTIEGIGTDFREADAERLADEDAIKKLSDRLSD